MGARHLGKQSKIWLVAVLMLAMLLPHLQAKAASLETPISTYIDYAPETPRGRFTLMQSVNTAIKNFPSVRTARFRLQASKADVSLAKTAYLPRLDTSIQAMRGTTNLITGTILPQYLDVIPVQAGTEQKNPSMKSYFGTNYGANFNWLLYDFGLRASNVQLADAQRKYAAANIRLTELDVAYKAADDYLRTVENIATIRAQQATVERMQAAAVTAHTLVDTGLRAGVDAALADYELSQAKIGLIQAERAAELSRVDLAEAMGIAGAIVQIVSDPLVESPSRAFRVPKLIPSNHPLLQARAAAIQTESAKVKVQDKAYAPHIFFQSAFWGRGTGNRTTQKSLADGILPRIPNFVVGFSVNFPAMDYFEIKFRKSHAKAEELAEKSNFDLAVQVLEQKDARARVLLAQARRIADETPTLVRAARENQVKTLERYGVGLSDMVAVAQAERMLAGAEVENAIAQVEVWRAILAAAYVQGDLKPFLNLVAIAERKVP
ncbi:MAG: TolC family protein [Candidatus Obscuribacterales bacterium]|jgi:outer membrane protein TolC|nr:TolC family protein [Candidatus Obscuribacterales bacterium]